QSAVPGFVPAGWILVVGASAVLLHSFARFALEGLGTPAPIAPTEKLVVGGIYRNVRNPMYVAVLSIILGQVLIFS
ncbi:MAG: isoprenylcysteine carboxyl methyltransferase, partial [Mesorhizobium sp.]